MTFDPDTLYYFFSAFAQVIAALTALIAVLIHFRINALRDFLIGDGQAILDRQADNRDYLRKFFDDGEELDDYVEKLQDAVNRGDIEGIKNRIKEIAKLEDKLRGSKRKGKVDFRKLIKSFNSFYTQIDKMIILSKKSFIWAIVTAGLSLISILSVELIKCKFYLAATVISVNIILMIITGQYFVRGILIAFKNFTQRFESYN